MKSFIRWVCCCLLAAPMTVAFAQNDPHEPVSSYVDPGETAQELAEGVTGRITTDDGSPVVGAMIVPESLEADAPPIPEIAITSDVNGEYEWPLPPGSYEVSVIADGYQNETKQATFGADEVATVDFKLRRTP